MRYVPDGSLCTASVEQILSRDSVQRNCFELALYIMTASPIASVRVFETVQRRRCRRATFGALPTLSVRDRAIIVLNDHRFWGYASGPSSSGNTLLSSIHGHGARRRALPRERFRPLTPNGHWIPIFLLSQFEFWRPRRWQRFVSFHDVDGRHFRGLIPDPLTSCTAPGGPKSKEQFSGAGGWRTYVNLTASPFQ